MIFLLHFAPHQQLKFEHKNPFEYVTHKGIVFLITVLRIPHFTIILSGFSYLQISVENLAFLL